MTFADDERVQAYKPVHQHAATEHGADKTDSGKAGTDKTDSDKADADNGEYALWVAGSV